jgi:hypothetical protein
VSKQTCACDYCGRVTSDWEGQWHGPEETAVFVVACAACRGEDE